MKIQKLQNENACSKHQDIETNNPTSYIFFGIWSSPTFNIYCDIQVDNSCLRQTDFRMEKALQ